MICIFFLHKSNELLRLRVKKVQFVTFLSKKVTNGIIFVKNVTVGIFFVLIRVSFFEELRWGLFGGPQDCLSPRNNTEHLNSFEEN